MPSHRTADMTGTQETEYDAIVIGSGITGGWAAKELTEKGLRTLMIERGRDVATFPLFAFGGAGPVHAHGVARILRSPRVIYPLGAGVTSTVGFLVAPLLALPAFANDATAPLAELERRNGGRLGVAALDTASGRRVGYRADELFPLCSTFKFLAAAFVLARVDRGEEKFDRRVVFSEKDLVTYSPVTKEHVAPGSMSMAEICDAAVTLSDNTAGNLTNFLDFSVSGSGAAASTTIHISSSGQFAGGVYTPGQEDQAIVLQGVDLPSALGLAANASDAQIIQELLSRGKLIVDSAG